MSGEQVDEALLEQPHVLAHLDATPANVHQRVDHQLTGTVIGDFATALDSQDFNAVARLWAMCVIRALTQRVDGSVLEEPELVGSFLRALGSELAHREKGWGVVGASEPSQYRRGIDRGRDSQHQSTITTAGWSQSSR